MGKKVMIKYKVTKSDYPEFPTVLSIKYVGEGIELHGPLCLFQPVSPCGSGVRVMGALFLSSPSAARNPCYSSTSLGKECQACRKCGKTAVLQGRTHAPGSGFARPGAAGLEETQQVCCWGGCIKRLRLYVTAF